MERSLHEDPALFAAYTADVAPRLQLVRKAAANPAPSGKDGRVLEQQLRTRYEADVSAGLKAVWGKRGEHR